MASGLFWNESKEALVRAEEVLETLELLGEKENHGTFLGGWNADSMIAVSALMRPTKAFILDEPTAGGCGVALRNVELICKNSIAMNDYFADHPLFRRSRAAL